MLRLQPGDALTLFDGGAGGAEQEWPASIVSIGRRDVEVLVGAPRSVERELPWPVTLAVAPPANDRADWLIEKAAELGAAVFQPLAGERSVLRLAGARAESKHRHWQAVAAAASEQCGRVRVMRIEPVLALPTWLDHCARQAEAERAAGAASCRRLVLSLAPDATLPGARLAPSAPASIVVLSGPEGGLAPSEERLAIEHGFVATSLGRRVLRSETAPLALLAWLGIAGLG